MSEVLKRRQRCVAYCRVSTDERLSQEFNSIDAQRESGHAYVASQRSEWMGFRSRMTMTIPAIQVAIRLPGAQGG